MFKRVKRKKKKKRLESDNPRYGQNEAEEQLKEALSNQKSRPKIAVSSEEVALEQKALTRKRGPFDLALAALTDKDASAQEKVKARLVMAEMLTDTEGFTPSQLRRLKEDVTQNQLNPNEIVGDYFRTMFEEPDTYEDKVRAAQGIQELMRDRSLNQVDRQYVSSIVKSTKLGDFLQMHKAISDVEMIAKAHQDGKLNQMSMDLTPGTPAGQSLDEPMQAWVSILRSGGGLSERAKQQMPLVHDNIKNLKSYLIQDPKSRDSNAGGMYNMLQREPDDEQTNRFVSDTSKYMYQKLQQLQPEHAQAVKTAGRHIERSLR